MVRALDAFLWVWWNAYNVCFVAVPERSICDKSKTAQTSANTARAADLPPSTKRPWVIFWCFMITNNKLKQKWLFVCACVCTQSSLWRLNLERHDDVLLRTSTPSCIKIPSTANHCTYLLRLTHGVLVCSFPLFALFFALSGWAIFITLLLGIMLEQDMAAYLIKSL